MRLAAAGAVALCLGLPLPARASQGQAMAPNSVVNIADPGTTLGVPRDGRLRGYEFAGEVLGVATGSTLEQAGGAITATAGQKLWVFAMRWTDSSLSAGVPKPVNPTVVVDGTRIEMPLPDGYGDNPDQDNIFDTGPMYWVASVPARAADVAVELSAGGLAQDFSLTHMAREGTQPAVLYRDPTSWRVIQPLALKHDIPAPDPQDPTVMAQLPVAVGSLTLTWFGPHGTSDVPSDASQAWLIPALSSQGVEENAQQVVCFKSLPPSDITLTVPGGQPVASTDFPGLGTDTQGVGAFPDQYGFKVPASIATAVLTVNPGTAQVAFGDCSAPDTVTLGSTSFDLTLPTPSTVNPPAGAVTSPPPIHNLSTPRRVVTAASHEPGPLSGGDLALIIIAIALVAIITPPLLIRRRGRRQPSVTAAASGQADGDPPAASNGSSANGQHTRPPRPSRPVPTVLLVPPKVPPPLADGLVQGLVLGGEEIEGFSPTDNTLGPTVVEILLYLSLHPQRQPSAEELRDEICAGRPRDLTADTVRRYIGIARSALGDEHVPRSAGGYSVAGVTTDWVRFCEFTKAAESSSDPAEKAAALADALVLVRGPAFSGHLPGTYVWADTEDDIAGTINNAVLAAALGLAALALEAGDTTLVAWAVSKGVIPWPTEDSLHELALDAAATLGPARLDTAWKKVHSEHRRADATPSSELEQYYYRLRSQFHQAASGRP